jgi:hypothetical protein
LELSTLSFKNIFLIATLKKQSLSGNFSSPPLPLGGSHHYRGATSSQNPTGEQALVKEKEWLKSTCQECLLKSVIENHLSVRQN